MTLSRDLAAIFEMETRVRALVFEPLHNYHHLQIHNDEDRQRRESRASNQSTVSAHVALGGGLFVVALYSTARGWRLKYSPDWDLYRLNRDDFDWKVADVALPMWLSAEVVYKK